jgi:hypothetical protein
LEAAGAVNVSFFYSLGSPELAKNVLTQAGWKPFFHTQLDNGEVVTTAAREERTFNRCIIPTNEQLARSGIEFLRRDPIAEDQADLTNMRAMMWNDLRDGEAMMLMEVHGLTLRKHS